MIGFEELENRTMPAVFATPVFASQVIAYPEDPMVWTSSGWDYDITKDTIRSVGLAHEVDSGRVVLFGEEWEATRDCEVAWITEPPASVIGSRLRFNVVPNVAFVLVWQTKDAVWAMRTTDVGRSWEDRVKLADLDPPPAIQEHQQIRPEEIPIPIYGVTPVNDEIDGEYVEGEEPAIPGDSISGVIAEGPLVSWDEEKNLLVASWVWQDQKHAEHVAYTISHDQGETWMPANGLELDPLFATFEWRENL